MRTNRTKKGFILLLVVILIALAGIVMSFLTSASNTMLYQANNTYLQACQRNLTASGLAWAKINLQKDSSETPDKMIELDVTEMDIRGSSLTVDVSHPAQTQPQVRIRTSCSRGRKNLTSDMSYSIRP
jgi:type II secretory pathway component PulK